MGSSADDAGDRKRAPAHERAKTVISAEDRERIERRLERMPLERDGLLLAMRQFGESFESTRWRNAYEALSPEQHNRVLQVTGNLKALSDNAIELVRLAATITGLRPPGRRPSTNVDIEAVRADGGLTGKQANALIQLKELCDRLRHEYAYVDAADVHAAVRLLLKLLPGFTASYIGWLAKYGIDLRQAPA